MAAGRAAQRTGLVCAAETEKVPVPVASPVKQAARIKAAQLRQRTSSRVNGRGFQKSINELKKLFNSTPQQRPTKAEAGARRFVSVPAGRTPCGRRGTDRVAICHQCARPLACRDAGPDDRRAGSVADDAARCSCSRAS